MAPRKRTSNPNREPQQSEPSKFGIQHFFSPGMVSEKHGPSGSSGPPSAFKALHCIQDLKGRKIWMNRLRLLSSTSRSDEPFVARVRHYKDKKNRPLSTSSCRCSCTSSSTRRRHSEDPPAQRTLLLDPSSQIHKKAYPKLGNCTLQLNCASRKQTTNSFQYHRKNPELKWRICMKQRKLHFPHRLNNEFCISIPSSSPVSSSLPITINFSIIS